MSRLGSVLLSRGHGSGTRSSALARTPGARLVEREHTLGPHRSDNPHELDVLVGHDRSESRSGLPDPGRAPSHESNVVPARVGPSGIFTIGAVPGKLRRIDVAAIVVAVLAAGLSFATTVYSARLGSRLREQEREKTKAEQVAAVMARYRDPLLRAAFDLQSRLYNIVEYGFFRRYYRDDRPDLKGYAVDNTLYVLAEYLGWVEILRRDVRFLDLGDQEVNRDWTERLDAVRRALLDDRYGLLQILNGQQRAIGELMAVTADEPGEDARATACLGFAAFVAKLDQPAFSRWFVHLREDIDTLARESGACERLVPMQHSLIDLIDFLDPDHVRLPASDYRKLSGDVVN